MDARERERLGGKRVKAVVRDGVQGTGSAVFEGFEAGIFGIGIGTFWSRIGREIAGKFDAGGSGAHTYIGNREKTGMRDQETRPGPANNERRALIPSRPAPVRVREFGPSS